MNFLKALICEEFYESLKSADDFTFTMIASCIEAVPREGYYRSGCSRIADRLWIYVTEIGSPNRYLRVFFDGTDGLFRPVHWSVSPMAQTEDSDMTIATARLIRFEDE